ncbi:MAG: hypothetical protein Kow0090_12450 [Myxococcota bacterium]
MHSSKLDSQTFFQTVLFTDIKGSTAFFNRYGDEAGLKMLKDHEELLFPIIKKYEGNVVKTIGDAIMAVFDSADKALRPAIEMQVAFHTSSPAPFADPPLTIRAGLYSGITRHRDNDVFGDTVNLASRMESLADGGQIIISHSVYELIRHLPGFVVKIQGEVVVKGHHEPISVYRVLWDPIREYVDVPPSIPDIILKIKTPADSRTVNVYTRERVIIGRQRARPGSPGSDIVVRHSTDEELTKRISRQHILIAATEDGYTISDLSARGTELSGTRIPAGQAVELPLIGKITIAKSVEILFEQILDPSSGAKNVRPSLRMILPDYTMAIIAKDKFTIGTGKVSAKIEDKKEQNIMAVMKRVSGKEWFLTITEGNYGKTERQELPINTPLELFDGSKWTLNDRFEIEFIKPPR